MAEHEPAVRSLEVRVYRVPTERAEADGTLAWSMSTLVTAQVEAGDRRSTGYTYATAACKPLIDDVLGPVVLGRPALDVTGTWEAMVRAVRNLGRPGLVACAISAVDMALWGLKAELFDLPLAGLLGTVRDDVPINGSGGFTTYDEDTARAQLDQWVGEWQIPRVTSMPTAPTRASGRSGSPTGCRTRT